MKKNLSEIEIIRRLTKNFSIFHKSIYKGIGDDSAVISQQDKFQLVTVDSLVENDHFNTAWSTPEQIGMKSLEVNVSDIASMGGIPLYLFISLTVPSNIDQIWLTKLFQGIKKTCDHYKISLCGGDTTHGSEINIAITLIGETKKPILRSGAKTGDMICCTGNLGASTAGLNILRKNDPDYLNKYQSILNKKLISIFKRKFGYLYKRHLIPAARLNESIIISRYCNSMIDVSDGLASEVRHICNESNVGAEVYYEQIKVQTETVKAAKILGKNPVDFALSGGEDFELVFTIPKNLLPKLKNEFSDFFIVGKIVDKKNGINLIRNNKKILLPFGYDHFK